MDGSTLSAQFAIQGCKPSVGTWMSLLDDCLKLSARLQKKETSRLAPLISMAMAKEVMKGSLRKKTIETGEEVLVPVDSQQTALADVDQKRRELVKTLKNPNVVMLNEAVTSALIHRYDFRVNQAHLMGKPVSKDPQAYEKLVGQIVFSLESAREVIDRMIKDAPDKNMEKLRNTLAHALDAERFGVSRAADERAVLVKSTMIPAGKKPAQPFNPKRDPA